MADPEVEVAANLEPEVALCLGNYKIPMVLEPHVVAGGEIKMHYMLGFRVRSNKRAKGNHRDPRGWLWPNLGFPDFDKPHKLPLFGEILKQIKNLRKKRNRSRAGHVDAEGAPIPSLVKVVVRGRELLVKSTIENVFLAIGEATSVPPEPANDYNSIGNMLDVVKWFLGQLKIDLMAGHAQPQPLLADAQPASSSTASPFLAKDAIMDFHKNRLREKKTKAASVSVNTTLGKFRIVQARGGGDTYILDGPCVQDSA